MLKAGTYRKLLLGTCLLLLSEKGMSEPKLTVRDPEIWAQIDSILDQISNESLKCSARSSNEVVKDCIFLERQATYDECTHLKIAWDCYKRGLFKCEDAQEIWRSVVPMMNNISSLLGCPSSFHFTLDEENESFWQQRDTHSVIHGILLVVLLCLVTGVVVGIVKKRRPAADVENPTSREEHSSFDYKVVPS